MKKFAFAAVVLITAMTTGQALAADTTGFYIGGSLNQTTLDDSYGSVSGVGLGVYGGYNFNEWFGLESNLYGSGDLGENGYDMSAVVVNITPKFTLQLSDTVGVYAKIGLASMAVNISGYEYGYNYDYYYEDNNTGTGFTFGFGLNAAVTKHLNLRVSYDVTSGDVGYYYGDENTDIRQLALGLHYQF
ncbi:porin family protein [Shewanella sp. A25]|nr:porin family protein [Shewanella shenzhenensis]